MNPNLQNAKTRCELVHVGLTGAKTSASWEATTHEPPPVDIHRHAPVPFPGHGGNVNSCAWSPDGASLLSASYDNTLKVWDAVSGECLQTFMTFPESSWATIDEQQHRVCLASPDAWRWLGWLIPDPTTRHLRRIPLESFGPIPGLD